MSEPRVPALSRPLVRIALVAFASIFMAAPTPGDVGGCSGNIASTPVPGATLADQEFNFFDDGLCAHLCERLRQCGGLCAALNRAPDNCSPDSPEAFAQCVRGDLRSDIFGLSACPHQCPGGSRYRPSYQWDVEACGHAMLERSCGSLQGIFADLPTECVNACVTSGP